MTLGLKENKITYFAQIPTWIASRIKIKDYDLNWTMGSE